ncbi:neurexin-1-like [Rhinichthys klamathensis goyatoka]|uniref:neurexin-1-like n=1 Tax=Rhinichthys klamathensis goyatoka TaxID=3034132 RepID=UPI0024B56431|nr:neurexin-1-like [Rhinichthys klamathensis goyatoka]
MIVLQFIGSFSGGFSRLLKAFGNPVVSQIHDIISRTVCSGEVCVSRKEESVATFKGNEFFCYDLSMTPIQSSTDEITLSFRTLQRNGLMLHTGKSADYVNLSLKSGAVWLVINLGSGAFEALVEPVNGKFNDNAWHDVKVTRNLRQHSGIGHAMVNKLHYMVDIILIVFYFGLPWISVSYFYSVCLY